MSCTLITIKILKNNTQLNIICIKIIISLDTCFFFAYILINLDSPREYKDAESLKDLFVVVREWMDRIECGFRKGMSWFLSNRNQFKVLRVLKY